MVQLPALRPWLCAECPGCADREVPGCKLCLHRSSRVALAQPFVQRAPWVDQLAPATRQLMLAVQVCACVCSLPARLPGGWLWGPHVWLGGPVCTGLYGALLTHPCGMWRVASEQGWCDWPWLGRSAHAHVVPLPRLCHASAAGAGQRRSGGPGRHRRRLSLHAQSAAGGGAAGGGGRAARGGGALWKRGSDAGAGVGLSRDYCWCFLFVNHHATSVEDVSSESRKE